MNGLANRACFDNIVSRRMRSLSLTYSLADQNVRTTKSMGIYNFSVHLARYLAGIDSLDNLTILNNPTIRLDLATSPRSLVRMHPEAIRSKLGRILWDQWGVYRAARSAGHPWLVLPKGFCSFLARPPVQVAAYVHDIMGDYYRRRYPDEGSRLEGAYFSRALKATLRHATVFTNTDFSKSEILDLARRINLPLPRVVTLGYGFDPPPQRSPVAKENRVLLFASTMRHKRTDIAIRFLEHWLKRETFNGTIDCIGIFRDDMPRPNSPQWRWIGRVPPEEGRSMIRRSKVVVYTSEYEGFGMPPVEAVLEGTCPVYSAIPPILEVMSGAGHAFDNNSPAEFAHAMEQALMTPPESVARWSKELLARHNWPKVAARLLDELNTLSRPASGTK